MRILFILAIITNFIFSANAQKGNNFSVKFNEKNLIVKKGVPESTPIECTYAKASIKSKNAMLITINEKEPYEEWHSVFTINDENGMELNRSIQKTTSGIFGISLVLPSGYKGVLKLVSSIVPNDPNKAATMRLRSYSLANITIK